VRIDSLSHASLVRRRDTSISIALSMISLSPWLAVQWCHVGGNVQRERPGHQARTARRLAAPDERLHPRHLLGQQERLDEVAVGAVDEAAHPGWQRGPKV
jgi:hypothetical protein